eukprot:776887_1
MTDIYSLVFDIIATFKGDDRYHYRHLRIKAKPAILTLPIWSDFDSPVLRKKMLHGLHEVWICGSAFLSMYGGYSPTRADFTPSVLKLALDKLSKYPDQELFRFIDMDETKSETTSQYHGLLPLHYDHQFVMETQTKVEDAMLIIKGTLDCAYQDIVIHEDGYFSHY